MKRLLLLLILLPTFAWAQFEEWFEPASLRVDYTLTGNDKTTAFALKELIKESPTGAAPRPTLSTTWSLAITS